MTSLTEQLINKLEKISSEAHLPLEQRLIDTAVWFHKNKKHLPKNDPEKRLEFIEKMLDIQLEMMAMLIDRMQKNEGRLKSGNLWLPNGARYIEDDGSVVEF